VEPDYESEVAGSSPAERAIEILQNAGKQKIPAIILGAYGSSRGQPSFM
jgi:hypothetical protein